MARKKAAARRMTEGEVMSRFEIQGGEVTQTGYLISAATDDRYGLRWCNEMAIVLLNQVGVLVGERLVDLADLMRVIATHRLSVEQIRGAYNTSQEELEFPEGSLDKLIAMAKDHLEEQAARKLMVEAGIVLDLDTSMRVTDYRGAYGVSLARIFGRGTEADEAWQTALMTPLEAYAKMVRAGDGWFKYDLIRGFVLWCRQAVGLPEDLVDANTTHSLGLGTRIVLPT